MSCSPRTSTFLRIDVDGNEHTFPLLDGDPFESFLDACALVIGGTAFFDEARGNCLNEVSGIFVLTAADIFLERLSKGNLREEYKDFFPTYRIGDVSVLQNSINQAVASSSRSLSDAEEIATPRADVAISNPSHERMDFSDPRDEKADVYIQKQLGQGT